MTVRELIEQLGAYDEDTQVRVWDPTEMDWTDTVLVWTALDSSKDFVVIS